MKQTIKCLFAAIALIAVASCQKENRPQESKEMSGRRILVATFAASEDGTKTTIDGMSPMWSENDKILLTDGIPEAEGQPIEDPNSIHNRIFTLRNNMEPDEENAKIIDGGKSFELIVPSTFESTVYAIYPADAYVILEGEKLKFHIRAAEMNNNPTDPDYEEAPQNGTFSKANICLAKADGCVLPFKNVTSIIKIDSKTPSVKAIKISNDSQEIAGDFYYDFSADKVEVSEGNKSITAINLPDAGPYYIAIAPVTLPAGTEFIFMDNGPKQGGSAIGTKRIGAAKTLGKNKIYNIGNAIDGVLPCAFSVSDTKQVFFSKGNMYWTGSEFKFETFQHSSATSWNASHVSHFFWSKTASEAYKPSYEDTGATDEVLFTNDPEDATKANPSFVVNGASGIWRALSKDEWTYLLNTRIVNGGTGEGKSFLRAEINRDMGGDYGMILYPDAYTAQTTVTSYTSLQWMDMEAAGCVFLPAAGRRSVTTVASYGSIGAYWSSSCYNEDKTYNAYFDVNKVTPATIDDRYYGYPVRLVAE